MWTCSRSFRNRAAAMFVQCRSLTQRKLPIAFMFFWFERLSTEERNLLGKNGLVSSYLDVICCDIRQPEQVIGATRADAAPCRRMPPMKYITFFKLMTGSFQNVLTNQFRPHGGQTHCIL